MKLTLLPASLAGLTLCWNLTQSATGAAFLNSSSISIPDVAIASPYPSEITVSGQGDEVTGITLDLFGFSHTATVDIQIAVQSPSGTSVLLMGKRSGLVDSSPLNITFDDDAADPLPEFGELASQSYRPTSHGADLSFTAPGPSTAAWTTTLSSFVGENPNGVWKLFIQDFVGGDVGSVSGGWQLNITAVPEPADFVWAGGLGLAIFAGVRRRWLH